MRLYGSGRCPGQSNHLNFSGILLETHPLRLHISILLGTLCPLRLRTFDIPWGNISLTWGLILLVSLRVMASLPGASYSGIPRGETSLPGASYCWYPVGMCPHLGPRKLPRCNSPL